MFIPEIQTLPPELLFRPERKGPMNAMPRATLDFRFGRDAVAWGIGHLGLRRGDRVLVPCSICDVIVAEFARVGVELVLYSLDEKLALNIDDISGRIDSRTRAVYLIHYFGFRQDTRQIRKFCDDNGMYLFEDHAHSFFTSAPPNQLNAVGDVVVYSYRKLLPIPDGGGVWVRGAAKLEARMEKAGESVGFTGAAKLVLKNFLFRAGFSCGFNRRSRYTLEEWEIIAEANRMMESQAENVQRHPISSASLSIMRKIDAGSIIRKRRENYEFWLDFSKKNPAMTPIYPGLPDGVCPYSFPVLVPKRNEMITKMARQGVFLEPTLNPVFKGLRIIVNRDERFGRTDKMASEFVSLPLYQDLCISDLERLCGCLKKVI